MRKYVDKLWKGIQERLAYFDKDGSTCCSEAPAEGIFSILAYITENRASLTPGHLSKLCRVVKEGPTPGTLKALFVPFTFSRIFTAVSSYFLPKMCYLNDAVLFTFSNDFLLFYFFK